MKRISSVERREQLIAATVKVMRREGVQRLNLRTIAEEAGASLAAVHYCFEDKDDLLRHAVEHWLVRMVAVADMPGRQPRNLADVVDRIADAFWDEFEQNPDDVLAQIELVTWAIRESDKHDFAAAIYDRYAAALGRAFSHAVAESGEEVTWDSQELSRAFLMLVDGAALQFMADPDSPRHRATFRRLLRLLLADAAAAEQPSEVASAPVGT